MHRLTVFLILLACMGPASLVAQPIPPAVAIIVNPSLNLDQIDQGKLRLIYLRKQRYWPKGIPTKPVNLQSSHPLRLLFSNVILGSAPSAQLQYWNGQYFNGILPPYTVNSEEAVLRHVSQTIGGIGYVNACEVDDRVKPIAWIIHQKISNTPPQELHCK